MANTSQLVNQSLRRYVSPLLRKAEFQKIDARNGWRWQDKIILVVNIRAIGNYSSEVSGWPPGSVNVQLGILYTFIPHWRSIKRDKEGRLQPKDYHCHMRTHLECGRDQTKLIQSLKNPAEQRRKDLWWIAPDGRDAEEVAQDIAISLHKDGLPWFSRFSNLEVALERYERWSDSFTKFVIAAHLARELGDTERWQKYDSLAEAKARHIGKSTDRNTWAVSV